MAAQDYRLPQRFIIDDDDKMLAGVARRGHSPYSGSEHRPAPARWWSALVALLTFAWVPRPSSPRQRRHLCVMLLLLCGVVGFCLVISDDSRRNLVTVDSASESLSRLWSSPDSSSSCSSSVSPDSPDSPYYAPFATAQIANTSVTTQLPHIPPKIWQIYLSWGSSAVTPGYLASWIARSPSYMYTVLDADGARDLVGRLARLAQDQTLRLPVWDLSPGKDGEIAGADSKDADSKSTDNKSTDSKSEKVEAAAASKKRSSAVDDINIDSMPVADVGRDALAMYDAMPRRVLRADFLRYLVLALEGGVYSDSDTSLVRAVKDWVPASMRNATRLIVGLEADSTPPVDGTKYEVQFCQWTLASSPHHPTMWTMVHHILEHMRINTSHFFSPTFTDDDVLAITGPAAWTEVIYAHLNRVAGDGVGKERITWKSLHGMTEPRLFGDTLVLPINGFATGVPHSKASKHTVESTLVTHQFLGKWRGNHG